MRIKFLAFVVSICVFHSAWAGNGNGNPNPGKPAAPSTPVVIDGNGTILGFMVGISFPLSNSSESIFSVLTDKQYLFSIDTRYGKLYGAHNTDKGFPLFFDAFNCTGQAYTSYPAGRVFAAWAGLSPNLRQVYYTPRDELANNIVLTDHSVATNTGCDNRSSTGTNLGFVTKTYENVPSITGVDLTGHASAVDSIQRPILLE